MGANMLSSRQTQRDPNRADLGRRIRCV